MFEWNANTVRFRRDAAEYVGFDEKIAGRILPYLPQNASLCDGGCGLGYLSLALAPHCALVTAVDVSPAALAVLRENAKGAGNLRVIQGDLFSMEPTGSMEATGPAEKYDCMVFCMFGSIEQILPAAQRQCGGKVFIIKKNWANHRFTLQERPLERFTFQQACAGLDALGVPYQTEVFPLEMGQPFRTLEDAALFLRLYGGEEVTPAQAAARLVPTDSKEFPLYLPSQLPLGMIVLDAGDIPVTINKKTGEKV